MLSKTQLMTMLQLQGDMNKKINVNWLSADWDFSMAIMMEANEAIEHHGWKWWKKQLPDTPQLQMELVDIWHFMLSKLLVEHNGNASVTANYIIADRANLHRHVLLDNTVTYPLQETLLQNLRAISGLAAVGRISLLTFFTAVQYSGLSEEELFVQYVGKNVLNNFRQDNGYKEGTYTKVWGGYEDNEHLVELLAGLDPLSPNYIENLRDELSDSYPG